MSALKDKGDFRERPHQQTRYEIIDRHGRASDTVFTSAVEAAEYAKRMFPGQEQDEEHSGRGWDVQVVDLRACTGFGGR